MATSETVKISWLINMAIAPLTRYASVGFQEFVVLAQRISIDFSAAIPDFDEFANGRSVYDKVVFLPKRVRNASVGGRRSAAP
jgi:hypothetical protein